MYNNSLKKKKQFLTKFQDFREKTAFFGVIFIKLQKKINIDFSLKLIQIIFIRFQT